MRRNEGRERDKKRRRNRRRKMEMKKKERIEGSRNEKRNNGAKQR